MKLIAAVDRNWGIGLNGRLLVSIPSDQKFFRNETYGKVVIVGRKTLATFPNGLPLEGRTNIILTHDKNFKAKNATIVHSVEEALEAAAEFSGEDVYVIGGESIYEEFLPYCDTAIITKIDHAFEADAHMVNLDELNNWSITAESEEQTYFDLEYIYCQYERKGEQ